jgi:hypothetical protein
LTNVGMPPEAVACAHGVKSTRVLVPNSLKEASSAASDPFLGAGGGGAKSSASSA